MTLVGRSVRHRTRLCRALFAPKATSVRALGRLWSHNATLTTESVDTSSTPMLLTTLQSRRLDAVNLITHRFESRTMAATRGTLARGADAGAPVVGIEG